MTADDRDAAHSWLAAHHAKWATPETVLERIVQGVGFTPLAISRIVVGQANEVYGIETDRGNLILRLAHRPDPKFESEATAIAVARSRGVPAPEVLAVGRLHDEPGPAAFILERRLPGVMLADLLDADPRTVTEVMEQLGEILGAIHSVSVQGFGNLSPDLAGTHVDYGSWFIDMFVQDHLPETLEAVTGDDEATRLVHSAVDAMSEHRELLESMKPRLAHGDFSPTNVLVDRHRITGIIDWEAVKGAPQANDFAWWTTVHPAGTRTFKPMLAGYQRVAELDEGFHEVLRLAQLRILSGLLGYASRVQNVELYANAKAGLLLLEQA